jgi:cell division protein FtsI/penicillin-binding protein 2
VQNNNIYDRNNNLLAYSKVVYDIYITPSQIKNMDNIFKILPELNIKEKDFLNKCMINERFLLAGKQNLEDLNRYKLPGISVIKKIKRCYPLGKKSTTLGVRNLDRGLIKELEIVASQYHTHLTTTIDIRVQNILASHLEGFLDKAHPDEAMGIVVNMQGEILAMHTTASTDPEDIKDFYNKTIYGSFEFGSACKALTFLHGFHLNLFDKNTVLDTHEGKIDFGVRSLKDVYHIDRYSTVETILNNSSNLGTVAAMKKIGYEHLNFLKKLGLDTTIDLGFTYTSKPIFRSSYKKIELWPTGYGYGFITSPLNIIRAFLSIFTEGKIINPTFFFSDFSKNHSLNNRIIRDLKFSPKTIENIQSCLLTTASAHPILKKNKCMAKSGTVYRHTSHGYDTERFNNYYVLMVPDASNKPKNLVLLISLNPKPALPGGVKIRELGAQLSDSLSSLY